MYASVATTRLGLKMGTEGNELKLCQCLSEVFQNVGPELPTERETSARGNGPVTVRVTVCDVPIKAMCCYHVQL
jgi:hypothetical protein